MKTEYFRFRSECETVCMWIPRLRSRALNVGSVAQYSADRSFFRCVSGAEMSVACVRSSQRGTDLMRLW